MNNQELCGYDREIRSDEARRNWREVLDAVEHGGERIAILRYGRAGAVLVPIDWYVQQAGTAYAAKEQDAGSTA